MIAASILMQRFMSKGITYQGGNGFGIREPAGRRHTVIIDSGLFVDEVKDLIMIQPIEATTLLSEMLPEIITRDNIENFHGKVIGFDGVDYVHIIIHSFGKYPYYNISVHNYLPSMILPFELSSKQIKY